MSNQIPKMSLEEKVNQLFIARAPDDIGEIEQLIRKGIGGFMIGLGGHIVSEAQDRLEGNTRDGLSSYVQRLKDIAAEAGRPPLILAVDCEGGPFFNRLKEIAPFYKSPRCYGEQFEETGDLLPFKRDVTRLAGLMREIGLNMNFAPLFDTALPGYAGYTAAEKLKVSESGELTVSESVASRRSYSDNLAVVSQMANAAERIFRQHGIVCTPKHFPSYGPIADDQNPHVDDCIVELSIDNIIEQVEPYLVAAEGGAPAIMTGHAIYPALDPELPACMSAKTLAFFRREVSLDAVVVADEIWMGPIRKRYGIDDPLGRMAGVDLTAYKKNVAKDILQGSDVILSGRPKVVPGICDGLIAAAKQDKAVRLRAEEAFEKLWQLKA